jgi:hypothetical protein
MKITPALSLPLDGGEMSEGELLAIRCSLLLRESYARKI